MMNLNRVMNHEEMGLRVKHWSDHRVRFTRYDRRETRLRWKCLDLRNAIRRAVRDSLSLGS